MYRITWKYINSGCVECGIFTSYDAYMFRLNPSVEVLKIEKC